MQRIFGYCLYDTLIRKLKYLDNYQEILSFVRTGLYRLNIFLKIYNKVLEYFFKL